MLRVLYSSYAEAARAPDINKAKGFYNMPALVTKTIRITEEQERELDLNYKGSSSLLFRELFQIWRGTISGHGFPGIEMMKLKKRLQDQKE